jgi:hypothetical protein
MSSYHDFWRLIRYRGNVGRFQSAFQRCFSIADQQSPESETERHYNCETALIIFKDGTIIGVYSFEIYCDVCRQKQLSKWKRPGLGDPQAVV